MAFTAQFFARVELVGGLPAELGPFDEYDDAVLEAETSDLPVLAYRIDKRFVRDAEPEPAPDQGADDTEPAPGD